MCAVLPMKESRFLHLLFDPMYLLITNFEVDIKSVECAGIIEVAYQVLHHSVIKVALFSAIVCRLFAHLDSRGVKWHVLILERGHKHYVLEMLQS